MNLAREVDGADGDSQCQRALVFPKIELQLLVRSVRR